MVAAPPLKSESSPEATIEPAVPAQAERSGIDIMAANAVALLKIDVVIWYF
jgi:hypothetical protein